MLKSIFRHSSGLNWYFRLLNSGEGWPITAAYALYVLHSFYPAKHNSNPIKGKKYSRKGIRGGLRGESGALVFMEFLGQTLSFREIILGNWWSSSKHQTMSYHKKSCWMSEMKPNFELKRVNLEGQQTGYWIIIKMIFLVSQKSLDVLQ